MTTWIIIALGATGLIASLFYSVNQQMDAAARLANVTSQLEEQTAKADAAILVMEDERAAVNDLTRQLRAIAKKRDKLAGLLSTERTLREVTEEQNAEYKRWADSRLPDSAIGMLNDSPLYPGSGADPLHNGESTDDTGVAPEPSGDNPQPTLDEPDRPVRRQPDDSERPAGGDQDRTG